MAYTDLITFCPDTAALVAEVRARHPERLDETDPENPRWAVTKTPTVRGEAGTLAVLRVGSHRERRDLEALEALTVLGTWEQVQADPALLAVYDSVHDRTPVDVLDDEGQPTGETITPPLEIGRFF